MKTEEKIDKIYDMVHAQNVELAKHIAHQEQHSKTINDHKNKIEELERHKNTSIGRQSILSFLFGSIGTIVVAIFKH